MALEGTFPARADRLIAHGGAGRIRLGMTLDEARPAVPAATFKRASDGVKDVIKVYGTVKTSIESEVESR